MVASKADAGFLILIGVYKTLTKVVQLFNFPTPRSHPSISKSLYDLIMKIIFTGWYCVIPIKTIIAWGLPSKESVSKAHFWLYEFGRNAERSSLRTGSYRNPSSSVGSSHFSNENRSFNGSSEMKLLRFIIPSSEAQANSELWCDARNFEPPLRVK